MRIANNVPDESTLIDNSTEPEEHTGLRITSYRHHLQSCCADKALEFLRRRLETINPGHWTEDMRDETLEPADLSDRNMIVVDVGGGTGFTTLGSIEYWPDPQRGIREAYRVLKLGGKACVIGPVYPTFWLSRFFADVWMLFPREEEYIEWFRKAGFKDIQLKRIGPKWYRGVRRHGLIMGCSVTGVKPASGDSPLQVIIILVFKGPNKRKCLLF